VSGRVAVVADLRDYVVAVAGLPRSVERVDDAAGAIVVVDGATAWWDAAALAVEAGAAMVLVAEPGEVPLERVGALVDLAARSGVPILVHRARLREDLVAVAIAQRGGVAPRVTVAECRAATHDLPAMVRDAVGWTRALAGGGLVVAAAAVGRHAGTALLRARGDGHVVGSLLVAVTSPEGAVLRVQALGEATTELEIDAPLGRTELATSTVDGRLVAPARYEAGERAALRRAVDTLVRGLPSPDLERLLHDAEAASAVLDPAPHARHL
jgi:hypothetical protein